MMWKEKKQIKSLFFGIALSKKIIKLTNFNFLISCINYLITQIFFLNLLTKKFFLGISLIFNKLRNCYFLCNDFVENKIRIKQHNPYYKNGKN